MEGCGARVKYDDVLFFFFQAEDGIRDVAVTGVQTCALPILAVTFSPAAGSGTVTPTTPVSTGSDGIAALTSWTLSPTAGSNTLTAASGSLSGSPVTFTATGTAGAAATIAPNGGGAAGPPGGGGGPP